MLKRLRNKHPLLIRFCIWIIMPLLVVVIFGYGYFKLNLPQREGQLLLPGLKQAVKVIYDDNAVPHIWAKSDLDAFYTMGYIHAQHRLWQMDSQRRLGQGRLSEVFGKTQLKTDQFMRTLGLYKSAQRSVANLSETQKLGLQTYADGVNALLAQNSVLPVEYQILDVTPEPWKIEDSLLQIKLMALNLDGNYKKELDFALMVKTLGYDKAKQIKTDYRADGVVVSQNHLPVRNVEQLLALSDSIEDNFRMGGEGVGSNGWVVSGEHTRSGKPLLANDPHLKTQIPSAWYLAEINGDKLHVTGATMPGVPFVLIGHNKKISWGVTALTADVQDIYLERTHPQDENLYEVDGQWLPMNIEEQWINVRTDFPAFLNKPYTPVKWHVRSTRHGPLLSDVLGKVEVPMALKWTALNEDDVSYAGFLNVNYAQDWTSFKSSLKDYSAPALNFIYADTQGNIGYIVGGALPIRQKGDGSLPMTGWDSDAEWLGKISNSELPQVYNPASGYVVTANNKIHADDYPYVLSRDWAPGYRAKRIDDLLREKMKQGNGLTVEDFAMMQGDDKNIQAEQVLKLFTKVSGKTERQKQAIAYLQQWDLHASEDSVATAIYHNWLKHFNRLLLDSKMQVDRLHVSRTRQHRDVVRKLYPLFLNEVVNGELQHWCDISDTQQVESCEVRALSALDNALDDLTLIGGSDIDDWQWGELHQTYYPHSAFSSIKLLNSWFNRSIASGGDGYTVNVAQTYFSRDNGFRQVTGASYRQVIDLSDFNHSGFINNTGQSGNVFSDNYDDFIDSHKQLQLLPMRFGDDNLQGQTLLLSPTISN